MSKILKFPVNESAVYPFVPESEIAEVFAREEVASRFGDWVFSGPDANVIIVEPAPPPKRD